VLGFVVSIPIAGPTSALVFRHGLQGQYEEGFSIACGAGIGEGMYAGIAYWGFGNFLTNIDWLLPFSKVLGAVLLLVIGTLFMRYESTPVKDKVPPPPHPHPRRTTTTTH
jgi:threonine/homoserine/homoserine lactone efflux protein